jgi:serine/threonine protein phosphatase 1
MLTALQNWFTQRSSARPYRVPKGMRVYAIGDIHGRVDLLHSMMSLIDEDIQSFQGDRIIEVFLGDYIDRGWDSRAVIDTLCDMPEPARERVTLRGNHEEVLLSFLKDPKILEEWAEFGGLETLFSYGIQISWKDLKEAQENLHALFCQALPDRHKNFFNDTELMVQWGDYVFVHAGLRPGLALDQQVKDDLLWMREPFLSQHHGLPVCVVHGHTPQETPDDRGYRIGLDTGAYVTHQLTCLVLEGKDKRFITTRQTP